MGEGVAAHPVEPAGELAAVEVLVARSVLVASAPAADSQHSVADPAAPRPSKTTAAASELRQPHFAAARRSHHRFQHHRFQHHRLLVVGSVAE